MKKTSFWNQLADWFTIGFSGLKSFVVWGIGMATIGVGILINYFDPDYDKYNVDLLYPGNKVIAAVFFIFVVSIIVTVIRNMIRSDRAEDAYHQQNNPDV